MGGDEKKREYDELLDLAHDSPKIRRIEILEKAKDYDPSRTEAIRLLFGLYCEEKDYDKAIENGEALVKKEKKRIHYFNLMNCYRVKGNYIKVYEVAKEGLEQMPANDFITDGALEDLVETVGEVPVQGAEEHINNKIFDFLKKYDWFGH